MLLISSTVEDLKTPTSMYNITWLPRLFSARLSQIIADTKLLGRSLTWVRPIYLADIGLLLKFRFWLVNVTHLKGHADQLHLHLALTISFI